MLCMGTITLILEHLSPSEDIFLDKCLIAMQGINPSLHWDLSRIKRCGILTWILGWGVFSNAQSIRKIKENLHTLQRQNQLQDKSSTWPNI